MTNLADARVTDKKELEEVVVFTGMHCRVKSESKSWWFERDLLRQQGKTVATANRPTAAIPAGQVI